MKKLFITSLLFTCFGCSVTIVWAPKEVVLKDSEDIEIAITGSDLKGNDLEQSSHGEAKLK